MIRRPFLLLLLLLLLVLLTVPLFVASPASAQVQTGTPPFGSFGGSPDIVNLGNLNGHLTIHAMNKPGRGTNFTYDLSYDSSVWYPLTSGGATTWHWLSGWTTASPPIMGYATYQTTSESCQFFQETRWVTEHYQLYSGWVYIDSLGTAHAMIGAIQNGGAPDCGPSETATLTTNDGSGYKLSVPDETLYNTAGAVGALNGGTFTDRNGNKVTQSGTTFTDTLGTTALTVTGSGTPSSPYVLSYTAPSGASASYTMSYVAYTVKSNFGCTGISEYGPIVKNLVDKITLPDGSYYQFTYEPTPGYSGDVTSRLASVRLPTAGTISYTYTSGGLTGSAVGSNDPIVCADGSAAGLTRAINDGTNTNTWTYSRTQVSGNHWQTKVTTPADSQNSGSIGDDTVIDFQKDSNTTTPTNNFYETQRLAYQGSSSSGTLLRTTTVCYNTNTTSCATTTVSTPVTQRNVTVQLPGASNLTSLCIFKYAGNGTLTERDDYDYGAAPHGALLKTTTISYAPLGNITAFQQQVTVKNGAGTTVSQTNYNYDESAVVAPPGTSPQHISPTSSRGNLTSVHYPVTGLTAVFSYYDTGLPKTATDVNGAVTTYSYPDSTTTCGNAFPTSLTVTQPITMSTSSAWSCSGGVPTSQTDQNNQATTTIYNDAFYWRPANISFPDGGQTSWTYNSPTSVTTTTKMNSTQNVVSTVLLDGLGRTLQTQLNSDPQGVDYSVITYDALGRPYQTYNPTRCSPPTTNCGESTWGYTTAAYDAIGRATKVTLQDGSVTSALYTNNTVTATDPASKKRQSTFDALGRLTQVTEDPGGLGYVTTYGYDALSNLTNVTQNSSPQRTFTYDALSRLVCESNPEIQIATCPNPDNGSYTAGTIRYGYDNGGNLATRQAPAPNQTGSATVTTTYSWDALHRLSQKSYSDGTTPTSNYYYDQQAPWGWNLSNYIGRLTTESTSNGTANLYNYDSMGRPTIYEACTPLNCSGTSYAVQFSYDLAGNVTSIPVSKGSNFFTASYSYNTAGRPTQVTSSLVDAQHPATLATVDSSVGYYPHGGIRKATLGNGLTSTNVFYNTLQPCLIDVNNNGIVLQTCNDSTPSGNVLDLSYNYNQGSANNGNVVGWNATGNQSFVRTFGYDSLNRLSTLNQSSGNATGCSATFNLSWTYDAWGNRTDQTVNGGTCNPFHATVNTKNQLVDSINNKYQYDAAGNMIQDATHTYFYDAENRLIQVDGTLGTCSTATVCYLYDAGGLRVESNHGSWQMDYVHDLSRNVVADWQTSSGYTGWATGYVYLNGSLLAQYQGSTTHFAHADHLGSTRLLTGLDQSVVQNLDYLPFGELNSSDSGINTHQFTADERDSETGLDHTWFRQYSSTLGRWSSPDPAGLAAVDPSNPQSWNRYAYVINSPLTYIDPRGLTIQMFCMPGYSVGYDDYQGSGQWGPVSGWCTFYDDGFDYPASLNYNNSPTTSGGGGGGGNTSGGPSLSTVSKNLNRCAAQLSQTKSLSALTKNTKLPIPEVLGSNFFGDVFSLATGSGGLDQGAGIAAEGTLQIVEHAGAQVAVGTLTTISKPISATAGVYNPVAVGTASQSFGGTVLGRAGLGLLKLATIAKVGWDGAMYLAAEAACAAPAWTQ